jgi:hypothetical protein
MTYRRFKIGELRSIPATLATVEAVSTQTVASVASPKPKTGFIGSEWEFDLEERQAIAEIEEASRPSSRSRSRPFRSGAQRTARSRGGSGQWTMRAASSTGMDTRLPRWAGCPLICSPPMGSLGSWRARLSSISRQRPQCCQTGGFSGCATDVHWDDRLSLCRPAAHVAKPRQRDPAVGTVNSGPMARSCRQSEGRNRAPPPSTLP